MLPQKGRAQRGDGNKGPLSRLMPPLDESALIGFFPYRETWTRRAPRLEDFGIRARPRTDPLQEVQDQRFNRVRHFAYRVRPSR